MQLCSDGDEVCNLSTVSVTADKFWTSENSVSVPPQRRYVSAIRRLAALLTGCAIDGGTASFPPDLANAISAATGLLYSTTLRSMKCQAHGYQSGLSGPPSLGFWCCRLSSKAEQVRPPLSTGTRYACVNSLSRLYSCDRIGHTNFSASFSVKGRFCQSSCVYGVEWMRSASNTVVSC